MAITINNKTSHIGQVVELKSSNMYHDSYYSAVVFDKETGKCESIEYGSTAFPDNNSAKVDADAETMAAYKKHLQDAVDAKEAATLGVGKTIEVVRGRKVAKGTTGKVFWHGVTKFGWSVGFITDMGDKLFTAETNVQVI